jgi:hypothetical protein
VILSIGIAARPAARLPSSMRALMLVFVRFNAERVDALT